MDLKILTTIEAAELLNVSRLTMLKMAARGDVPCARIGRKWAFVNIDLIEHIRSKCRKESNHENQTQPCRSINAKTALTGGSKSQSTDDAYSKVLGLTTAKKRKNITTN